jgi:putative tryptophan/tyrosine transport system substrate-binding protein
MTRRLLGLLVTLTLGLLLAPLLAEAPPAGKVYCLGVLRPGLPPREPDRMLDHFRQGLQDLGYTEGQTIALEVRWDEHQPERRPALAADLVRLQVDLIVTGTNPLAQAAKHATRTIPIVMAISADPVALGLVASLARPGGNITGLSSMGIPLIGKRFELLKEAVPGLARVALLLDARLPSPPYRHAHEVAAHGLGVQLLPLAVWSPDEFAGAFQAAIQGEAQGLILQPSPLFDRHRARLAELALASRLPTMAGETGYAHAVGLMDYGANKVESWYHAATYVDKILKGAKPADLPVEQPRKFEFVINLKTAQTLGLTLPPHLLVLADEVIK